MSSSISLAMIVAPTDEEAQKLDRCLASAAPHVDEIAITITGQNKAVDKVCKKYKAKVSHFDWIDDFAAARTFSFKQATGDWILWLDADDEIQNGENLRKLVAMAAEYKIDGFAFMYHYGFDDDGSLTETHWKTQLVKNDGHCEWRGAIHEDLIQLRNVNWVSTKDVTRIHRSTRKENAEHYKRNLAILEKEVKRNPGEPRNWFYLARTYLGMGVYEHCIEAANEYLALSGWDQERYEARMIQGEAFMRLGDHSQSLTAFSDALLECEDIPDAYVYKARTYVAMEEWKKALTCLEIAGMVKGRGVVVQNPSLLTKDLPLLAGYCLIQLGRFKEAYKVVTQAKGSSQALEDLKKTAAELVQMDTLVQSYQRIAGAMLKDGQKEAARKLLETAPAKIADDSKIVALRKQVTYPKTWAKNSLAIFCGQSVEEWDGNSPNKGGIGGSETAVIELAERFAADGWEVVVYNWCNAPAEGTVVNGVRYMNYWLIDSRDRFDVLWLWRSPGLLDAPWKARKVLVDMHDISNAHEWTPERIEKADHIMVKSKYHRSLYPLVPDDKFVIVGNGIDLDRFKDQTVQREKNRFVYTSTPNRGLEQLLDMWPKIRERIPDAELHVYYGWNTFYLAEKDNPAAMKWMQGVQRKMDQEGIVDHGRVGQNELAADLCKSSLWLYPTQFPEIHCITALEMQAAGVIPVTSGYAALAETQCTGVKLEGDPSDKKWQAIFVNEVVEAYKALDTANREQGYVFVKEHTWDKVYDVWRSTLAAQ